VKRLREEGHRVLDDPLICESVLRQRAVVDAARSTTQQRRAQARRPDVATETLTVVSGTQPIAEVDYSDLPGYPVEEWRS
jgi:hypothetical protein